MNFHLEIEPFQAELEQAGNYRGELEAHERATTGSRTVPGIRPGRQPVPEGDIEAVAFLVLMQATKDMDEDLKTLIAEVKAMTAAKRKLRDLIAKVSKDVASNAGQTGRRPPLNFQTGMGSQKAYHQALLPFADPASEDGVRFVPTDLFRGEIVDVSQLVAVREGLIGKLIESMSEMSESTSLRLQMIMERMAQMMSTLSNLMKKKSSTQDALVQNIK